VLGSDAAPVLRPWKRLTKYSAGTALLALLATCIILAFNAHAPSSALTASAEVLTAAAFLLGVLALVTGLETLTHSRPNLTRPLIFLLIITLAVFAAHMYIINAPPVSAGQSCAATKQGCVGDESYYLPEALRMLDGLPCSTNSALTPNCHLEHPFLTKAMMAAGMAIFGVNSFGARIFIVVLGTLCIPLLYVLVSMLSGNRRFAFFSCLLLAADTLFFVQSSIAMLEIPSVFFGILAFVFYFWQGSIWKLDNQVAAGISLGLSMLCKETGVFMALALVSYHLYASRKSLPETLKGLLKLAVPGLLVFIAGLQVYAMLFTTATTPNFISEIQYIFSYGNSLKGCDPNWIDPVLHRCPTPFDWILFYSPSSWFSSTVTVTITSGGVTKVETYVGVAFYKMTNPIVVWLLFAWAPLAVAMKLRKRPDGVPESRDDSTAIFMLFWFFWTWFPYVLLWSPLVDRTIYPFYILATVPAFAAGSAYFITREWFPSKMAIVYLIAAFAWFFLYFPVKDFLPVWIRVLLGR